MRIRKSKIAILLALVVTLIASSMMVSFAATDMPTKKMTVYNDVIKSGKYAYCATGKGIYRVNLKNNRFKRILKTNTTWLPPVAMKLYKGYIYYCIGDSVNIAFYRVKTDGTHKKSLGSVCDYAISDGKIFYTRHDYDYDKEEEIILYRKMTLTGTNKKKSSYNVYNAIKRSNVSGYRIKHVSSSSGKGTDYLVKPNSKKIKLCSYTED